MTDNIEKLRELVPKLRSFSQLERSVSSGFSEIEMEKGVCFGWKLLSERGFAVHKWYNSEGSKFPRHKHTSIELLFVYEGQMDLVIEDKKHTFKEGEYVYLKPGTEHSAYFPKDTWYITLTLPPAQGFPR